MKTDEQIKRFLSDVCEKTGSVDSEEMSPTDTMLVAVCEVLVSSMLANDTRLERIEAALDRVCDLLIEAGNLRWGNE